MSGMAIARVSLRIATLALCITAAQAAGAATPLHSVSVSPDVTLELGTNGQLAAGNDVAVDAFDGTVALAPLGTLPAASDVSGYELLANGDHLLCFDTAVELPGPVTVQPGDVVRHGSSFAIEFAAAANGVPAGAYCDAIARDGDGKLLLSFDVTTELPGGILAHDEDLVRLDAPGTWSLFFDGSEAGVPAALDVDGAHRFANGHLAISFDGSGRFLATVGEQEVLFDFDDEDVLEYDASVPTWSLIYDGSAADPDWAAADADAIALPEPGLLVLLGAGIPGLLALGRARIRPQVDEIERAYSRRKR